MAQPIIPILTASDQSLAVLTLVDDDFGRWNATSVKGTAATVHYSFGTSAPSYINQFSLTQAANTTFQAFSETMKMQAREALAAWSAVTNITFVEVADTSTVGMRFFSLSQPNSGSSGFAWGAGMGSEIGSSYRGDIWVNRAMTD